MSFLKKILKEESPADVINRLPDLIKENEQYMINCRRTVHRFAEVGGKEVKTSAFVQKEAEALGLPAEKVSETGLMITLDTGHPGNGVALRAELDALPIPESPDNITGPRCVISDNPETSHACGHDAHVGMLLGAMRVLHALRDQLSGRIYFCFEEGEENGAGWLSMLDALGEKEVNTVFALHVSSRLDSGLVSVEAGPRTAGVEEINAAFIGRGGHASRPDLSINPVYAAASAVTDLAVAFVNQMDPNDPVTLGITSISGGTAENAFPDTAQVIGGMRFFSMESGKLADKIVRKVFSNSADMHNCGIRFEPSMSFALPPTINDEDASDLAFRAFKKVLPEDTLVHADNWFASDTFSEYLTRYKGVYAFLGTRNEALGTTAEHHNEHFDVDESMLTRGALCYAAYAAEAAKDQKVHTWAGHEDKDTESEPVTAHKDSKYSLDSKIGEILKSQEAINVIESIVPGVITHPQVKYFKGMTLRKAAKMLPDVLTPEIISRTEEELSRIED